MRGIARNSLGNFPPALGENITGMTFDDFLLTGLGIFKDVWLMMKDLFEIELRSSESSLGM